MDQIRCSEAAPVRQIAGRQRLRGLRDVPGVRVQGAVEATGGLHGVQVCPVWPPALNPIPDHIYDSARLVASLRGPRRHYPPAPGAPGSCGPGRPGGPDGLPRLGATRGRRRAGRRASRHGPTILVRPPNRLLQIIQDRPVIRNKPPGKIPDIHRPLVRPVHRRQERLSVFVGAVDLKFIESLLQVLQGDEPVPVHVELLEQLGGLQFPSIRHLHPLHRILHHLHTVPRLPIVVQPGRLPAVRRPLPPRRQPPQGGVQAVVHLLHPGAAGVDVRQQRPRVHVPLLVIQLQCHQGFHIRAIDLPRIPLGAELLMLHQGG
mmetsp:Transcript_23285/g.59812  ORF Transcript_23285/g.59812 Transcript_23285/m.59812 type:complete len:318 (+) Transcript_23285:276-1229(+)